MKILAIDTTGEAASVALVQEKKVIAEFFTNYKKNHSVALMPMVDEMLKSVETDICDVDFLACTQGPGSFTGLRIGAATIKAMAHGLSKKIIPIPTLDVCAYNVFCSSSIIAPIMDARRNQVYTAFYKWETERLIRLSEYMAKDVFTVMEMLKKYDSHIIFTGDAIFAYEEVILQNGYVSAPLHLSMQRAAAAGALALKLIDTGEAKVVGYNEFFPLYLRAPQAERELERKNTND